MSRQRQRAEDANADPFAVDLPELDVDSDTDFEAGLPPTAAGRLDTSHRGPVGKRHAASLNFEDGLPRRSLEKRAEPEVLAPQTNSGGSVSEPIQKNAGMPLGIFLKSRAEMPRILTWEALRKGEVQLGKSDLPLSLEQDVPPALRYWKASTLEEARRVLEALIESETFNPDSIRKVGGELRRVVTETVVKVYLPPPYEDAPVIVPPPRRAIEKAAALLVESDVPVTLIGEEITEAFGIETVLARVRSLKSEWLLAVRYRDEIKKLIRGSVFKIPARDDLVFLTNAALQDSSAVEWIDLSRTDDIIKFAFGVGRTIRLVKADAPEEQRIVFGVVLEPDTVDAQNDTISADEIEGAAHKFMENFQNLGLQHKEIVNGKLKLLESFIAPVAFTVEKQKVSKGSWLMKERVVDDELWAAVKSGSYTGFSIGGSGVRKPA